MTWQPWFDLWCACGWLSLKPETSWRLVHIRLWPGGSWAPFLVGNMAFLSCHSNGATSALEWSIHSAHSKPTFCLQLLFPTQSFTIWRQWSRGLFLKLILTSGRESNHCRTLMWLKTGKTVKPVIPEMHTGASADQHLSYMFTCIRRENMVVFKQEEVKLVRSLKEDDNHPR